MSERRTGIAKNGTVRCTVCNKPIEVGQRWISSMDYHFVHIDCDSEGEKIMSDVWFKHVGKRVTFAQHTATHGSGIDFSSAPSKKTPKSRQVGGKIIGTDGGGYLWVMLDKPFSAPGYVNSYASVPPMGHVAMEFRNDVSNASGQNRFIKLGSSAFQAMKFEDDDQESTTQTQTSATVQKSVKQESFFDTMKADAEDAAFRVASAKIAESVRNMIALALMAKLDGNATAETIQAVLNTPMGIALVQATAGYALTYLAPKKISGDPRVKRLAKEFRVAGMATAGGVVADEVFSHLAPIIESALDMLPGGSETSNVRVTEESSRNNVVELDSSEEERTNDSSKRMVAGVSSR